MKLDTMGTLKRTAYCGTLREGDIGKTVTVAGFVARQRDLGQLIFIDLRDRTGIVQLAFDDKTEREIFDKAFTVRSEYILMAEGISAEVINIHTVKPLDTELIVSSAKKTGAVVTAEEHSVIGGLGAAVCECLAENYPVPVLRVGVEDKFGRSGQVPELLEIYGLTAANIADKARCALALKSSK